MKCPFNTSYFNCTKKADALSKLKADIIASLMLNPTSSRYYVTSYGIIIGHLQDITNRGGTVTINGFYASQTGIPDMHTFFYSQVSPGDYVEAFGQNPSFYFVPYKNI